MAPEIIRGDNYGPEVDVWAIGVITYVMLAGFPPFDGENDVEVFASILSIKYDFPSPEWDKISQGAREFIQAILVDKPEKRLTALQALQHKWITDNVEPDFRINKPHQPSPSVTVASSASKVELPAVHLNASGSGSTGPGKLTPPSEEKRKSSKRENKVDDNILNSTNSVDDFDLNKKPKKTLIDLIDENLAGIGNSDANGAEPVLGSLTGELKTMKTVVDATSGKPKSVELERVVYVTYWKRLKEIQSLIKKNKKKK